MKIFLTKRRSLSRILLLLVCAILVISVVSSSGCTGGNQQEEPNLNSNQQENRTKITLYFSDSQADKLIPEEREVVTGDVSLPEIAVNELIKGPQKTGLSRTIPDGSELLSLEIKDGIAQVNFNNEFQSNHWGGSAGETITVYSIVNTLAELEGIEKVQFLIEGQHIESLAGHLDLTGPIAPDATMIAEQ